MRLMSFALTTAQVRARTKTVTRRTGWLSLKPGTLLQPVVKAQGIPKGGKVEKIGGPIRVVSVRREPLDRMLGGFGYGMSDLAREGFEGQLSLMEFVRMFCATHRVRDEAVLGRVAYRALRPSDEVTRIEFEYVD